MTHTIGDIAPDFTLPGDSGSTLSLSDYKGQNIVLYFYPKDATPGCTTQAKDFTAAKTAFEKCNTVIIGMSKDSAAKHDKFIAKQELTIKLAADEEGTTLENYGVWVEKNNYGRKYMGIVRTTFLIDAQGVIQQVWNKVRVKNHVEAVLEAAQAL
ncbi:MAG: thioredoxin-dependent thiol peroxidase [Kordiimonadaceae bacterium]|nr:thioredoxin-dependent thiol peroxidase [Kordiimonadaceae bacterium]